VFLVFILFVELPTLIGPFQAYGKSYALGASIKFVYDAQQFVGPLLLERLITFLQEKDVEANSDDYEAPPMRVGYEQTYACIF